MVQMRNGYDKCGHDDNHDDKDLKWEILGGTFYAECIKIGEFVVGCYSFYDLHFPLISSKIWAYEVYF